MLHVQCSFPRRYPVVAAAADCVTAGGVSRLTVGWQLKQASRATATDLTGELQNLAGLPEKTRTSLVHVAEMQVHPCRCTHDSSIR